VTPFIAASSTHHVFNIFIPWCLSSSTTAFEDSTVWLSTASTERGIGSSSPTAASWMYQRRSTCRVQSSSSIGGSTSDDSCSCACYSSDWRQSKSQRCMRSRLFDQHERRREPSCWTSSERISFLRLLLPLSRRSTPNLCQYHAASGPQIHIPAIIPADCQARPIGDLVEHPFPA